MQDKKQSVESGWTTRFAIRLGKWKLSNYISKGKITACEEGFQNDRFRRKLSSKLGGIDQYRKVMEKVNEVSIMEKYRRNDVERGFAIFNLDKGPYQGFIADRKKFYEFETHIFY